MTPPDLGALGRVYIYQLECQADKLVDIEVQCEDATRQAIKWLPDSGADTMLSS